MLLSAFGISNSAAAECVKVKYYPGDCLDLDHVRPCTETKSSFVHQVCHDKKKHFMVIRLRDTRYPYCNIPEETVNELLNAPSVGTYYNERIKGNFSCQGNVVPQYPGCTC
jgi:hypothetical protein